MKNMYIILSILAIIVFFYFISFVPLGFIESFTNDEYKYLAPPPAGNTWSQDTITKFVEKYNNVNTNTTITEGYVTIIVNGYGITEEEGKYYIQNGEWPYDSYVLNYLKQNPDTMKIWAQSDTGPVGLTSQNQAPVTVSYLSTYWPNRLIYNQLIGALIESTQNPQPLSWQIYKGIVPDPNASQYDTSQTDTLETDTSQSVSPITSSSLTPSSTNLSDSDYNTLFGLCKTIILSN